MKKIGIICATLIAGMSLSACNNLASQSHKATSSRSSTKVVKHHAKKEKKQSSSSSSTSSSVMSESAQQNSQQQSSTTQSTQQSSASSQPDAWSGQQQAQNQAVQSGSPTSEDQARAMLGGANGDLQATRTSNGWTFSGDGYTATVGDDGSISHN